MADVTAIIPTWNRRELLKRLLERLRVQTHAPREILVMDNGSADDSARAASEAGARVIPMGSNTGFARAVNRGIGESQTEWVAILNNDVVPECDWLEKLAQAAEAERPWFATGKLLRASNPAILDGTFDLIARSGCAWRCGQGRPDGEAWARRTGIQMAPFTAALFRRELFDRVGLLDERFESYLEDVDFGLRCAARDCRGLYVPEAVAYHEGSATLGAWNRDTVRRLARNQVWIVAKHFQTSPVWPVVAGQLLWGLVAARHGAGVAWCRGKWDGLRDFSQVRREEAGSQPPGGAHLPAGFLRECEYGIRELQARTGFDLYWRIYFWLAPGGRHGALGGPR